MESAATAAAAVVRLPAVEMTGRKWNQGSVRSPSVRLPEGNRRRRSQKLDLSWSSNSWSWNGAVEVFPERFACRCKRSGAVGTEKLHETVDEALILKRKAQFVGGHLSGRCIYLVGMMGSGKSTVGKILSEVLGYSFFDSDKLVEQAVGLDSVAEIFKRHSEAFFRDSESEVLKELSSMQRLVVATGGGAVIRPINWKYMRHGITVWLDVPLDALARRIAAVGTASRPLLHGESGDAYTKAFARLSTLAEQRAEAYANADVRVCLEDMADKKDLDDVCELTPTDIATEALAKVAGILKEDVALSTRGVVHQQHL